MLIKPTTLNKRYNKENYLVQSLEDFIKYLEQKSSAIWTDYNDSDFGITLMEYIIFALYDIKYRLRLPILNYFNEELRRDIDLFKYFVLQKENSSELIIQRLSSLFDNFPIDLERQDLTNIIILSCKSSIKINRKEKEKIARYISNRTNKYRLLNGSAFVIDLKVNVENNNTLIKLRQKTNKSFHIKELLIDYRSIQEDLPDVYGFSDFSTYYNKFNVNDKLAIEQFRSFILTIDYFLADTLLSINGIKNLIDFDEELNNYKLPDLLFNNYSKYFTKSCESKKCSKIKDGVSCDDCIKYNEFLKFKNKNNLIFKENFIDSLCQYFDFDINEFYGPYFRCLNDEDYLEKISIKYKLFKKGIEYKTNLHLGPNLIYESSTNSFIKIVNKNFKSLRPKSKLGIGYLEDQENLPSKKLIDMSFLSDYWFTQNLVKVDYEDNSFDFNNFNELKKYNYLIQNYLLKLDWIEKKFDPSAQILVVELDNKYYYIALKYNFNKQVKYTYLGFHWTKVEAIRHAQLFYAYIKYVNTQSLDDFSILVETRFLSPIRTQDFNAEVLVVIPISEHDAAHEVIQFTDNIINKYFPMQLDISIIRVSEAQYRELQPYYRGWRRAIANHIRKKTDLDYSDYSIASFNQKLLNICKDASN